MLFIETSVFTRTVEEVMSRDEYRALQSALILRPGVAPLYPAQMVFARCDGMSKAEESGEA
jgi:hypothetical protein